MIPNGEQKHKSKYNIKLYVRENVSKLWTALFWKWQTFAGCLFIVLLMEAVQTSETSIYFNKTTRRYIPEGFHHHIHRRENLKSHLDLCGSSRVKWWAFVSMAVNLWVGCRGTHAFASQMIRIITYVRTFVNGQFFSTTVYFYIHIPR
jgi:hypothetical protein